MKKLYVISITGVLLFVFSCNPSDQRASPDELIGKHKAIFTEPPEKIPVPHSVDAPMLGNGYTGVALSGAPEKQVYYFSRNDFWRLKSSLNESYPAVLGKLEIVFPELEHATYRIEQDLYTAVTHSSFIKGEQQVGYKSFVSAEEDLMIIELNLEGEGELKGSLHLKLPGHDEFVDKPPMDLIFPAVTEQGKTADGFLYISRGFEEDVDIPTKAAVALSVPGNDPNNITLSANNPLAIVIAFSSNFKSDDCVKTVIDRVAGIRPSDLEEIEQKHKDWWSSFWSKSHVNLNDSLIEKQYYLSNYSMASFSRDPDFPPSIFGSCITKERPYWSGDYHLNYNHFAPYYGLFSSNHIEQAIPCNMPVLAQQERGEYYSEKVCGIQGGIMLPVGVGPLGIETTRRNELMEKHRAHWIEEGSVQDEGLFYGQKSNSSYAVVNMAQHFYSSYDTKYTRMYYPFVKGVATFWEHYLTFEDGRYVIYNDAIHEGTIGTLNPILSLGLVRLVLQTAIDMSEELQLDAERTASWQHILTHLSDYTYQERDGKRVFRYTEKGTDWWGDNTLGIQHIYPGGQIGLHSSPELLLVAHNTIDVMQRWIDFNGSNSFFPAAVRVGYDPVIILNQLHNYCKNTYPNSFQLNNPHGIENFSTVPNTINEMLCMGHGGILRVFPVWPENKDASFHQLRVHGAFLVSSELKDERVEYIEVLSERGRTLELLNPWEMGVVIHRPGHRKEVVQAKRLKIETSAGERIWIRPVNKKSTNDSEMAFDKTKWARKEGKEYPFRDRMLNEVIYNDTVRLLNKEEIFNLLGKPDRVNDNHLYYMIDQKRIGPWPLHTKTMVIKFSDSNTIEWIKIHE